MACYRTCCPTASVPGCRLCDGRARNEIMLLLSEHRDIEPGVLRRSRPPDWIWGEHPICPFGQRMICVIFMLEEMVEKWGHGGEGEPGY
jgi:hypothetical protein